MNRVTVELWFWLGNELQGEFESPSEMRSVREEAVEDGTSIGDLLHTLATRYRPISEKIFDLREKKVRDDVVMTYNDGLINPCTVYEQNIKDGDTITIFPMYTGG